MNQKVIPFLGLIWIFLILYRSKYFLHMLQLEGYDEKGYKIWLRNNSKAYARVLNRNSTYTLLLTVLFVFRSILFKVSASIDKLIWNATVILWLLLMLLTIQTKDENIKKPLVFTNRAKRLYIANLMLNILIMLFIYMLYRQVLNDSLLYFPIILFIGTMLYYFQTISIYLSNIIIKPLENKINKYYFNRARDKIREMKHLHIIGITGSFGKTSTKFIAGSILKEKYKVLNTPESYNTPMGLSKVINNQLNEKHQVFIAEMGARYIGEIRELAALVEPKIGVITSIGPTHLETFKNLENIVKTKYELIEELPTDGIAIFNYDDEYIKKLADKTFKEKILYGIDAVGELDIYAEDIVVTDRGTTFTIRDRKGNNIRCTSKLLGKHNIYNVLCGVSIAMAMGLNFQEIKKGIQNIQPIPHRLNIIDPGTGVIIIDDTFNSNPIGARAALDVLSQFRGGRKIIVTPGMVELGTIEEEANMELGSYISKVCDYAILIGKNRTIPIFNGLIKSGYNENNIFITDNLEEATKTIQRIARPRDIVLFENDLPDTYNE